MTAQQASRDGEALAGKRRDIPLHGTREIELALLQQRGNRSAGQGLRDAARIVELGSKADALRPLHVEGPMLVLPNAWDAGSARIFMEAGFPALGSTSAGIAFSLGYADGERISRDEMLAAVTRITRRISLPITADMEAGYGQTPDAVAETVRRVIDAGAVR